MRCQQILVLDQGRIVERGNHHDLLAAGGRYASLWDAQNSPTKQQEAGEASRPEPVE